MVVKRSSTTPCPTDLPPNNRGVACVDLCECDLLRSRGELDDLVSCLYLALFKHAEVEARTVLGHEQYRDPRIPHADSDPIARDAGLRHLEGRTPDSVTIANADLIVGQPFDGEVLAELPVQPTLTDTRLPAGRGPGRLR
jgi:hypothetical protein